jgi:hypothetical protein
MAALPEPKPPLAVEITTGPHGHKTELAIDGEPVTNATSFTLHSDVKSATTLTVTYINVKAEVHALVDVTAFNSENRMHQSVVIRPEPDED